MPLEQTIISVGRISTLVFVIIGCLIAPNLNHPSLKGIFTYIQEFQGFISPGVLAAFIFGLFVKKAPKSAGTVALILNPIIYGALLIFFGNLPYFVNAGWVVTEIAFLNRMAITFIAIVLVLGLMTVIKPLEKGVELPVRKEFDMRPTKSVAWLGMLVIAITLVLYVIFW